MNQNASGHREYGPSQNGSAGSQPAHWPQWLTRVCVGLCGGDGRQPTHCLPLLLISTLNIVFSFTNSSLFLWLDTNCKPRPCTVTNTKRKPHVIFHSFKKKLVIMYLRCHNYCHLLDDFPSKFQSFMTISLHINVRMQNVQKVDELEESQDDTICELTHETCHYRSYHSDIKYHMTLNIIFSLVFL